MYFYSNISLNLSRYFCFIVGVFSSYLKLFRLEKNSGVNELLNDNSKRNRRHVRSINIQMSVITWSIEFLTGCLMLILALVTNDITIIISLAFFDCILSFVMIPGAYILNTEATKQLIITNGWFRSFRAMFPSREIQPIANND